MEPDQFTSLFRRHAGLIHKIAFAYCRNLTDREDLVSEIALQLWRARDKYDPAFKETTWIYRIAINVAISFYRRHRRHHHGRVSLNGPAIDLAASALEPSDLFGSADAYGR
jgi:RNA polymerase sigma-70 factor (ECF subfamily)